MQRLMNFNFPDRTELILCGFFFAGCTGWPSTPSQTRDPAKSEENSKQRSANSGQRTADLRIQPVPPVNWSMIMSATSSVSYFFCQLLLLSATSSVSCLLCQLIPPSAASFISGFHCQLLLQTADSSCNICQLLPLVSCFLLSTVSSVGCYLCQRLLCQLTLPDYTCQLLNISCFCQLAAAVLLTVSQLAGSDQLPVNTRCLTISKPNLHPPPPCPTGYKT